MNGKIVRFVPEARLQKDCFKWLFYAHRELVAFSIPNGGKRDLLEAINLKRQGVKAGVPDIFIAFPSRDYHGLFIELKTIGGKVSKSQEEMMARLESHGYYCAICRTQAEFEALITWYLCKKEGEKVWVK